MIPKPRRDCPVILDGYMAEIKGYGRLAGSSQLQDIVVMVGTFGLALDSDLVKYYRHVKWADGREWTRRVPDVQQEIRNDVVIAKALKLARQNMRMIA